MLKDYRGLANDLKIKFSSINFWKEIEFNEEDKLRIKEIADVTNVNSHSIQIKIENNHTIVPSQYILYAICIKELAISVKEYIDAFELVKSGKNQNEIGALINNRQLDYSGLDIDEFSKKIAIEIFINPEFNLGAKSIVNGTDGDYKIRGVVDFFGSIILKPINIPNASSSILGKLIYSLTSNISLYNYLESRFITEVPYIIKQEILKDFAKNIFSFLDQYDKLNKINNLMVKNADANFTSIKNGVISLTSIFKTSSTLLNEEDLIQGGRPRYFLNPLFYKNDEFYYFSTEWTNERGSRLDLVSLIQILNQFYPEFRIDIEGETFLMRSSDTSMNDELSNKNTIYYGSPGTGKSHKVNDLLRGKEGFYERITFHPEYDNSSFVGGYRPVSEAFEHKNAAGEVVVKDEVKYKFVPQAFANIYTKAWNDLGNQYYLAIEEINRGNCAEIFGDIFQLLDRKSNYSVSPSNELKEHLNIVLNNKDGIKNGLKLPSNLSILATMNTSDQSLFPMDSAFKRRWDWEYIPICYDETLENESFGYKVYIEKNTTFNWIDFIKNVNAIIKANPNLGMDKCIGNYFIKSESSEITLKEFINKAIFYLWNDVFKDEDSSDSIFGKGISYEDFFPIDTNGKKEINKILKAINIEPTIV